MKRLLELIVLAGCIIGVCLVVNHFAPKHDPATMEEYVQACRDIAVRDHLILPVKESEYLRQEFESGQSPELAMSEWAVKIEKLVNEQQQ